MTAAFDFKGLALLIGSIAGLITVAGGFLMQLLTYARQGQMMRAGDRRDEKVAEIHNLVNGQSELLKKAAFQAGEKAGGDAERDNPTIAAHRVDEQP